jgi:hypothetical protein
MKKSVSTILEQKICLLYKKKVVKKWSFNLQNANFAVKYTDYEDTIFDLLKLVIFTNSFCLHNSIDFDDSEIFNECVRPMNVEMFDFYKSNLNEIEYFNTLIIWKYQYTNFILSAFLFCIKNKLDSDDLLKNFTFISPYYFASLFLNENLLSNTINFCILELKLFRFFLPQLEIVLFVI